MDHSLVGSYRDRWQAGQQLAEHLRGYAERSDVLVLGLPRGGIVVAAAVASRLDAPLRAFVVRKLGAHWQPELALGAIASGGIVILNEDLIQLAGLDSKAIESLIAHEQEELRRREEVFEPQPTKAEFADKVVICVDDGIATGASMLAAVRAIATCKPFRIVVAVPVASRSALEQLTREADEIVCPLRPMSFDGVGQFYHDFAAVTDAEVKRLLGAHADVHYHYACE